MAEGIVTERDEPMPARWLGITPACPCCEAMSLLLQGDDGRAHRFRIPVESMRLLVDAAIDMLNYLPKPGQACSQCWSQSSKSSGSPNTAGSPQEGQTV